MLMIQDTGEKYPFDAKDPTTPLLIEIAEQPVKTNANVMIRNTNWLGIGWRFGIGFGLALLIAVPLIMLVLSCLGFVALTLLGGALPPLV
jgi:hypothetical protein